MALDAVAVAGISRGEGQSFRVESSAVTIGRSDDATVVIEHRSLSRMHATIPREGMAMSSPILGAKNGTGLNNQRIQHASLKNGDLLRCGEVALRFQLTRAEPQQTRTESLPLPALTCSLPIRGQPLSKRCRVGQDTSEGLPALSPGEPAATSSRRCSALASFCGAGGDQRGAQPHPRSVLRDPAHRSSPSCW